MTTWGGGPRSHADLTGYAQGPGGRGRRKPADRQKRNPAARQAAATATLLATLRPEGEAVLEIDTPAGKAAIRLQDVDFDTPRTLP